MFLLQPFLSIVMIHGFYVVLLCNDLKNGLTFNWNFSTSLSFYRKSSVAATIHRLLLFLWYRFHEHSLPDHLITRLSLASDHITFHKKNLLKQSRTNKNFNKSKKGGGMFLKWLLIQFESYSSI